MELFEDKLQELMESVNVVSRRVILRKIINYLRKQNTSRITNQQNSNGSRYAPRSVSEYSDAKALYFEYDGAFSKVYLIKESSTYIDAKYPGSGHAYRFSKEKMINIRRVKHQKGKMLLGFRRRISSQSDETSGQLSISGKVAPVHHYGLSENGAKYPARELLTLSEGDKRMILDIVISEINRKT
jgi:phage virion morphogenesis protein